MFANRLFLALSLFLFFPLHAKVAPRDAHRYQRDANEWIDLYAINTDGSLRINDSDLQLIANLFYYSYLRSAITLEAQDIACATLQSTWEGWQNIAQTRMNPSLNTPYEMNLGKQQMLLEDFLKAQYLHRVIGVTYAQVAQVAINEPYLSKHAHKSVLEVREQARAVVAIAFLDVKKILGELFNFASQQVRYNDVDELCRFSLMDTIADYIPYFAMQSFIETERLNTRASEGTWEILNTLTTVSKQLWDAIETARAEYYLAHYQAVTSLMHNHGIADAYTRIMFNEDGIIPPNQQDTYLPNLS